MAFEVTVVESRRAELQLDAAQVDSLLAIGRQLATSGAWWGDETSSAKRSVVEVVRLAGNACSVTFRDVVGVVQVGALQIRVRPKISDKHFSHLIFRGRVAPRTSDSIARVDADDDYTALLAMWCVAEAETILKGGLRPDYTEISDELTVVRGRLDPLGTSIALSRGRAVASCEFEEFNEDSSVNRIVKAACYSIAAAPNLGAKLRSRARRACLRMDGVGSLRPFDRFTRVSRLTQNYARVLPLARLVLAANGITTRLGALSGRTFLIRTPELVEDGLRSVLSERLRPIDVRKRRLALGNSGITINPDLVFNSGAAIADIKYRHLSDEWHRPSLYQAVAFAAGFGSTRCAIFGFASSSGQGLPTHVKVGGIVARCFAWDADSEAQAPDSENTLVAEVADWLNA